MSYNLTNEQIKDTYQQLVQISASVLVNGTGSVIPSVSVTASYATTASYAANVSSPDWSAVQNKPAGIVSSSIQVDYTQISNIPVGILSSSAQIASEISGAFDSTSGSLAGRVTTLEQFSSSLDANFVSETQLANATGSFLTTGSINNDLITLTKANGSTFDLLVNNVVNALTASFAYTASYALNTISGSVTWDQVQSKPAGLVSSSTQINYPNISNIPTGIVSGSDQLTGSFDQRYVLSGSISQADWNNLLNKPAGIISSSVQVDYTQISNVPVGILSSSAQIATEISGAFNSTSGSLAGRVTNLEQFSSSLDATFATDAELTAVSSSLAGTITGVDGRLVILEGKTLLSSSAQIATEISGAFTSTSASLATTITANSSSAAIELTGLDGRLITLEGKTLLSSSAQIATEISGAFNSVSGSLAGRIAVFENATLISSSAQLSGSSIQGAFTGSFQGDGSSLTGLVSASYAITASYANYVEYVNVGNKPTLVSGSSQIDYTGLSNIPVGILSSSAQIATEISGAFDAASGSFSTRVTNLEAFSSSLDSTYATDAQLTSVSSSLASSITGVSGRVTTLEGKTLVSGSSQLNNSILTGMTISGSFSGSFQGDGSGLTGVVTSIAQSTTFAQTFTSVTSVTVTHNLDSTSPFVQVYDSNDELLIPQTVKITDNNTVTVTFSQSTSGKVIVAKAGHIISGSVLWNNLVGTPSGLVSSSAQVNLSQVTGTTFGSSTYTFPGSVIVTGSVYGEVENLTVASNTASINFSSGSFFILTVPSSSVTHVTATNVGLGQTVNLLVKQQATTGSLTFNSTFKFATGSAYTVSNAANAKDILTFVTLDETGSVYTSFVKRLV